MIRVAIAAAAVASLGLTACGTWMGGSSSRTSPEFENANAHDQNSNSSVQPGRAGPSPSGGQSNPGTSGTVSARPADQQPATPR